MFTAVAIPASSRPSMTASISTSGSAGQWCQSSLGFVPGMTTVGSDPACDVVLPDIAAHQAEVRRDDLDEYRIFDTSADWSSRVDGRYSAGQSLHSGDRVTFGPWTFVYARAAFADHGSPYGGHNGGMPRGMRPKLTAPALAAHQQPAARSPPTTTPASTTNDQATETVMLNPPLTGLDHQTLETAWDHADRRRLKAKGLPPRMHQDRCIINCDIADQRAGRARAPSTRSRRVSVAHLPASYAPRVTACFNASFGGGECRPIRTVQCERQNRKSIADVEKLSLTAITRTQLELARQSSSGRSATTVFGGHEHTLRQTVIAINSGQNSTSTPTPARPPFTCWRAECDWWLRTFSGTGRVGICSSCPTHRTHLKHSKMPSYCSLSPNTTTSAGTRGSRDVH